MKTEQKGRVDRSRSWLLTVPAAGDKGVSREELIKALEPYDCYAGQLEEGGKTAYKHWQILLRHGHQIRFSTLKNRLPSAHIEACRDVNASYRYVTKTRTRVAGEPPLIKGEWTDITPGKRTDLENLRHEILTSEKNLDEILLDHPSAWRFEKACRALIEARDRKNQQKMRDSLRVSVFYGATGTGKTRAALAACDDLADVCRLTHYRTGAFDGYVGQKTLVMDEFRGQLPISELLNLLDIYPLNLPARYYDRPARFERVIICSNIAPWAWYPDIDQETKAALARRLSEVKRFKADFTSAVIPSDTVKTKMLTC